MSTQSQPPNDKQSPNAAENIPLTEKPPAVDAPKKSGMGSLVRLLPFARPFIWHFAIVLALVVVLNGTSVLQPYLVKIAIDTDISKHQFQGLLDITWLYCGIVVIGVISNYIQILILQFAGQSIIRSLRIRLFTHIEGQAMSFFDSNAIGRLVTNVSNDTETVNQFFTNFLLSMIRDGLAIIMIVIAMFRLNGVIAGYSMIVVPIIFLISIAFRNVLRTSYQRTRTRLSNIVAFLAENLAGMRITQIFHQERRQANKFYNLNEGHRQANVKEFGIAVIFNRLLELLGNIAVAAVVWLGGRAVLHHAFEFGTLYAFITYIRQFFQPINSLTQQWNTLQSATVAADRIGKVLSVVPAIQDAPDSVYIAPTETVEGRITFNDVSFSYKPDEPVLRNLTFSVEPGQFVGFVGPTGAGKSSIMSLLTRFYEPSSGFITLDNHNIANVRQHDLHRLVGLVQQDVNLFSGTVADNIRLFRHEISESDVMIAAKTVGAHDIIMKLPDGYQTMLYGKGANLSMGERQLISFARIVALNPSVLILDEATANLDSHTEELVQAGLQAVSQSRTTLVIAHRLSTIRHADNIVMLERGRIVEQGNHDQLLANGGLYADLHSKSGVELQTV